jgi:4-diphosphocytidyl-2-C-methyl-D-erythritol kinase
MSRLRTRAPGKVNLCLFLGPTRGDGRHELVSIVEPVSLADEVELGEAGAAADGDEVLCPGVEGVNLAARALADFRTATGWDAPPRRVTVAKRVPVAAGMGGGSADAAATLRLAARAAGRVGDPLLRSLAAGLGSDVPAALEARVALATGAGEEVRRLDPLEPHALLILPSPERLATTAVFAEADRLGLPRTGAALAGLREAVEGSFAREGRVAGDLVRNDLQEAAHLLCPAIDAALEAARAAGADHALVSGSGPTVAGIYLGDAAHERAAAAADALRGRFPGACAVVPVDESFATVESVDVPA